MGCFKSIDEVVNHIRQAHKKALDGESKLAVAEKNDPMAKSIMKAHAMSGVKTRHLFNNLCEFPGLVYSEVGAFTGISLMTALYKNSINANSCDNWSEFGGPKSMFVQNLQNYESYQVQVLKNSKPFKAKFYESDFKNLPFGRDTWQDVDVYFYDGPHDTDNQRLGVSLAIPALSKYFILIVDDWNWHTARDGTFKGLDEANVSYPFCMEIFTDSELVFDKKVINRFEKSNWHNGIAIFACERNDI